MIRLKSTSIGSKKQIKMTTKLFSGKIDVDGHKEESEVDLRFSGHKIQITDATNIYCSR